MDAAFPDFFRCPACRGPLRAEQGRCVGCGRPFSTAGGICDFLAAGMTGHERRQADLHAALAAAYRERYQRSWAQAFSREWNALFLRHLPSGARRVLDAGCGPGELAVALAAPGMQVVGMDISRAMLEEAVRRGKEGGRFCWVACGCERMPYADAAFDAVCFRGALHHMEKIGAVLAECSRVLVPGGRLLLSEPNDDSLLLRLPRWFVRTFVGRFGKDHKAFGSRELFSCLEAAGFAVEAHRYFSYFAEPLCGMGDLLPLMHRLPAADRLGMKLLRLDEWCSRQPLLRRQSFELFVAARKKA